MKIKRYKLRDDVTKEELLQCGFEEGGTWIKEDARLFLSRCFEYKKYHFEFSINIAFGSNIGDWNDFDNVLVLDEDFCQPYTPFYGENYGKEISGFVALEYVIQKYNEFMSGLSFLTEI